ncbi:MAG: PilW family protein [Paucibacter sp.]|nr:PilW family protein [Roseateles sp.]
MLAALTPTTQTAHQGHAKPAVRRGQRGISLIELLVAVVVGMAAVIVVMQVYQTSDAVRRTTGSVDSAQTTGTIALTVLQRDLRQAGQGLMSPNLLLCGLTLTGGTALTSLAPLTINHPDIPAGDTGSDTLLIAYGSGNGAPEGARINAQPAANSYSVGTITGFAQNDRVLATPASRAAVCQLRLDLVSVAPLAPNVTVSTGVAGMANGTLFNLGRNPRITAYAVRGGRLTTCDLLTQNCTSNSAANWGEVADGVVALRALYGRDTSGTPDAIVDAYDQTTPATVAAWSCVLAAQVVMVTRSGQLEKEDATAAAPTWAGSASAPISLSASRSDWKRYRYRTFESTVPLRNVGWPGAPAGC